MGAPPIPIAELEPPSPPRRDLGRWISALVVVVAILITTAVVVSSQPEAKSPIEVLTAAAGRTTGSSTARVNVAETIMAGGQTMDLLDITGASDFAAKRSTLTMSSQGLALVEMRQVGDVTYMSSSYVDLPNGAHWITVRPSDIGVEPGDSALGTNDPSSGLKYLSAIKGNPRAVGQDDIGGVATTHYTFTIDLAAYMDKVARASKSLNSSSPLGSSFEQLRGIVDLTKLPAAAWIDDEGRVRKFTMTIDASQGGVSAKVVATTKYSGFDEPVSVPVPAASDTVAFSDYPAFFKDVAAASEAIAS